MTGKEIIGKMTGRLSSSLPAVLLAALSAVLLTAPAAGVPASGAPAYILQTGISETGGDKVNEDSSPQVNPPKMLDGSFLRQMQERDSVLIADQLRYGFHLSKVAEGTGLGLPDFREGLMDKVEIVSSWNVDTVKVNGKKSGPKTYDLDISLLIASFDEGEYELPPLSVVKVSNSGKNDTLVFKPQILDVRTMPVDTATFVIHDIKGQIRYPLTFAELVPYILGVLAFAALVALAVHLWRRRKRAADASASKEPAHLVALRKLDRLRGDRYWAPEMQKAFYSGITDTLREYIVSRYAIDAMEMTTAEIFDSLKHSDLPKDLFSESKALFQTADFVKFAKALATKEENAAAIPVAVRFVTSTYQTQIEEEETDRSSSQETKKTDAGINAVSSAGTGLLETDGTSAAARTGLLEKEDTAATKWQKKEKGGED